MLTALLREQSPGSVPTLGAVREVGGPRAALEVACGLFADQAQFSAAGEIDRWAAEGITAFAYTDPLYPDSLQVLPSAPAVLFVGGQFAAQDRSGVAIIGTRQPSAAGVRLAQALATVLVAHGRTVVSGLAAGIDTAAHAAALAAGGRSIAVLGNGLHHVYPRENEGLQSRMSALVSQFLPDHGPTPKTFPQRNAVMAGISAATVIVEAGERSGARIQARHATEQRRPLFLMEPLLKQTWARDLAADGRASVLTAASELIAALASCSR